MAECAGDDHGHFCILMWIPTSPACATMGRRLMKWIDSWCWHFPTKWFICGAYIFIIKTITRLCTLHLFESPFTSWSPGQRKGYGSSPYCRMEENGAQLLGDFTKPNDLVESLTFLDLKVWGLWYHDMPRILLVLVDNSYHDKAKGWIYKFSIGDICIDWGLPWIYMIDIYMSLECKICIYYCVYIYIYTYDMMWNIFHFQTSDVAPVSHPNLRT